MHCINTGRIISFDEFVAGVIQFISLIPTLPINDAESIYHSIHNDYLGTVCGPEFETRAAGLLHAAADAVCLAGGRAPLFF
jgi:hypothetical protein